MPSTYEELYQRLGVRFASRSGLEGSGPCPFHKDDSPSFSVNLDSGLFICHAAGCGVRGDFRGFADLAGNRLDRFLTIPESVILEAHKRLLVNEQAMTWLQKVRGITQETALEYKLGLEEDGKRLWIPVKVGEKYLNVRKHRIGKETKGPKTLNYEKGYGRARLWPKPPEAEEVWICEGELDCLVLRQLGLDAVTGTGGCGTWEEGWNALFESRNILIVYDADISGVAGAKLVSSRLIGRAKTVKVASLDVKAPGKDVTDYIVGQRRTLSDLRGLVSRLQDLREIQKDAEVVHEVSLGDAGKQEYVGKRVKTAVVIAGKDLAPFTVPKNISYTCRMGLKICPGCSIFQSKTSGKLEVEIKSDDQKILTLIDIQAEAQRLATRKIAGIDPTCGRFDWEVKSYYNIEEMQLLPDINLIGDDVSKYVRRQAYAVDTCPESNASYDAEGIVMAYPKDQHLTFLFPKLTPRNHVLENYRPSEESLDKLNIFQAGKGLVSEKLKDICADLSANVTRIYQRDDIIIAFDLVMHSMLGFSFQGDPVKRGWVEGLILGDTRCGKSKTAELLHKHYRSGEIITGENMSYAGLVGGLQQTSKRWHLTWGKMPLSDRRQLTLDEVSGMSTDDISRLSGIRSSGVAEITKIQTEKTLARVRLCWLSNPRAARPINTYDSGAEVIRQLIGKPEDVARFDYALIVSANEVPLEVINQEHNHEKYPHKYTSELCHELILWAWSRKREQVHFTKDATAACLGKAGEFARHYSPELPIVEPNEQRIKFARLGAAVAARLFSTEDGENLIVEEEHIIKGADLLEKWFSNANFNYRFYSEVKLSEISLNSEDQETVKNVIFPQGLNFCRKLLEIPRLRYCDFEDLTGLDRGEARIMVSKLMQAHALKRIGSEYAKLPGFIQMLKAIKAEDVKKGEEIPF